MFRELLNNKIGNLIAYLASKSDYLSLTKLLKLLYIIDEKAMMETGVPITWLEYKAWGEGPVADSIYNEIKKGEKLTNGNMTISLDDFIKVDPRHNPSRNQTELFVKPSGEYSLSKFSRKEIKIIDSVVNEFGNYTAQQLVDYLHRDGSLWSRTVNTHNLQKSFEMYGKMSDVTLPMAELINNDEVLQLASHAAFQALSFHEGIC